MDRLAPIRQHSGTLLFDRCHGKLLPHWRRSNYDYDKNINSNINYQVDIYVNNFQLLSNSELGFLAATGILVIKLRFS